MTEPAETIAERLHAAFDSLTRAERQLADSLLQNYPVSGLGSITLVAKAAGVSTPTVARMVQKLGFTGFPDFQAELRRELEAKISDPITKHDTWVEKAPDAHILNRFTDAVMGNIRQTLTQIDIETFDRACTLLADPGQSVYVVGGRITRSLADYFFMHMQVLRADVTQIQSMSNAWVHYLLDMKPGDVVVIFDVRRYENATLKLAEMAREKGARIILFTDQWRSPVHEFADCTFCGRIVVPSAWDSSVTLMLMLEIVIAEVQEHTWASTRKRMEELEDMFDRTRFFRKFT
ncbi:MurR/RpiR family transcriptional regulator [Thalassovita taeanensis]|uniref:Transcriptional regulator, RpiR family n=1 Tax=Thalassovita taeanensis TaxID=657014 RepID=A0A1H9C439_9RHOB|nr:MurR/RpiR family transcriptional regulator [Thalassovita taeanensis]SEP95757.1 transcriptional regulator, RpiR family [Thalassovita taeanensis]